MHGARGGAPSGPENVNGRHGGRSAETVALRKLANEINRSARKLAQSIDEN